MCLAGDEKAIRGARRQLAIAEPSHFAVSLRQCNLGTKQNQYLVSLRRRRRRHFFLLAHTTTD